MGIIGQILVCPFLLTSVPFFLRLTVHCGKKSTGETCPMLKKKRKPSVGPQGDERIHSELCQKLFTQGFPQATFRAPPPG